MGSTSPRSLSAFRESGKSGQRVASAQGLGSNERDVAECEPATSSHRHATHLVNDGAVAHTATTTRMLLLARAVVRSGARSLARSPSGSNWLTQHHHRNPTQVGVVRLRLFSGSTALNDSRWRTWIKDAFREPPEGQNRHDEESESSGQKTRIPRWVSFVGVLLIPFAIPFAIHFGLPSIPRRV